MDRNIICLSFFAESIVALRKESVDRNIPRGQLPAPKPPSLSARRAWIEIRSERLYLVSAHVALRKESVDRNLSMGLDGRFKLWSLSARRAWIEISSG